jgi:multidrug efflux pump subunit AcrA (membrane-fusion protein)
MKTELRIATVVCGLSMLMSAVGAVATAQQAKPIVAEGSIVSLIEERSVPAKEAGTLAKINVKEGDEVRAYRPVRGDRANGPRIEAVRVEKKPVAMAIIEQEMAQIELKNAVAAYDQAVADARNRLSIEHAESLRKVAETQLKQYIKANENKPGAISVLEIAKAQQQLKAAGLQVKQAEHEFQQNALVTVQKEAGLAAAEQSLLQREVYSPIDGVVVEVFAEEGEWVKPGDPVFRVVNLARLRVQANLNIADLHPSEVINREVTVATEASSGVAQSFTGRVTFVHPEIKAGGRFSVWAEVENRKGANGHYQLLPGMKTTMTVKPIK